MIKHKTLRYFSISLILFFQLFFLWAMVQEQESSSFLPLFVTAISLMILLTYLNMQAYQEAPVYENIYVACWVPVGAVVTFYLNHRVHLGPVIAAGIVGAIASYIPVWNKKSTYLKQLPSALYCGAFVGMSGSMVAQDFYFVLAAGIFTAVLLVVSKSLLEGVGGKTGTLAFVGVSLTSFLFFLWF